MPGCPSLVMRSLMNTALRGIERANQEFQKANIRRLHKESLQDRLAQTPANMPHHGNARRPHVWNQPEGTTMSILFSALREDSRLTGIVNRIQPDAEGKIPKQSHDLSKFHTSYSVAFKKICGGVPLTELSGSQQRQKLRDFLFQKFSVDPDGRHGACSRR